MLYIFRLSYVGYINTYKCYIFLLNWPLYHYVTPILVSYYNLFFLNTYFVWYNYSYSSLLLVSISMEIFFHHFILSLCVSLGLKWVSCRQHIYGSCFCIHSASLCLLVGAFKPFTFKVIIDMYVPIPIFLKVLISPSNLNEILAG